MSSISRKTPPRYIILAVLSGKDTICFSELAARESYQDAIKYAEEQAKNNPDTKIMVAQMLNVLEAKTITHVQLTNTVVEP